MNLSKSCSGDVWRLVEAAFCQPAETYERAATERRRRTSTFVYSSLLHHRRCFSHIWYGWKIRHCPSVPSACGLTDNRVVSLISMHVVLYSSYISRTTCSMTRSLRDTILHIGSIWLKRLPIIWAEIRAKRAYAPNRALSLVCWLICQNRLAAAVSSAVAVCHAVWSCSRTVSGAVNIAVDTTCHPQTRGRHPDTGRVTCRAVHRRPASRRRLDCHGAGLQVVPETHSRPSWDTIHYVLLFQYCTDGFHIYIPKDGKAKAMEYYCWWLTQRDGGPERRSVRRQAVPAVRYRLLCENGTAAAKLSAV